MQITEEEINMPFKDKLKSLRAKKNITQEQLAEQLHVSRSLIAKWENGMGYPDNEIINAMATYFGVDKQYFVADEDRTKARAMQIVGFAFLSAVVLALVASLFTISFLNGKSYNKFQHPVYRDHVARTFIACAWIYQYKRQCPLYPQIPAKGRKY